MLGADLPELAVLLEIFDEHLNRKAALDLELAVDARLRFLEHFLRQVGRDDFDPPSGKRRAHFLQAHRQRIRLLAGRAGGAPDPDALAAGARLQHLRHDRIAEMIERHLVAEEEGLVGGHGFDHLGDDRGATRPSSSARVRRCPASRICATAEAGGFRSDIACLRTGRDRNDPSGAYADTHSLAGSREPLKGKRKGFQTGLGSASSIRPTSWNFAAMMSLSNGFMMYSLAPPSSAREI